MKYVEEQNIITFMKFLDNNNIEMKSSSDDEIKHLKGIFKKNNLPESYLTFMKYAGKGISFLRGSSYTMNEIFNLKKWAIELLQEDDSEESLTDDDFVFFMHQGYQFYFFKLDESENPTVYFYEESENSKKFIKKYNSFTEFIIGLYNEIEYLTKN